MTAEQALARWPVDGTITPLGAGHIHDTYLITGRDRRFVLQRLNEGVFPDADLVMSQTERVLACWSAQSTYEVPQLLVSRSGAPSERVAGGLWRMWSYVEESLVVDPVGSELQARAAGSAFGYFQRALRNLPGPRLADPIADFLQLPAYLAAFDRVAERAPKAERCLIDSNRNLSTALLQRTGVIHGDCKVNNLLFDATGVRVRAIIDFDTVMYGHWAWDLGDLVRSVCFSKGGADVAYFAACLAGFAAHQNEATVAESVAAPAYVALMLGVRFLTDHLEGDRYFRTARAGENLHRAREQLALFDGFQVKRDQMREAARQILG